MPPSSRPQSSPPTNGSRPISSRERLSEYYEKTTGVSQLDRERIIPALALRSFHLPGNSWCDDWLQYFNNNHPVLGIFCHHKLHPVRTWMRVVMLIGSICFGLLVTNIIWLWFFYEEDEVLLTISLGGMMSNATDTDMLETAGVETAETPGEVKITKAMIVLWTVGGSLHAIYDNVVWYLSACACCLPGQAFGHLERYKRFGTYFVTLTVTLITAVATFVIVLRAALDSDNEVQLESAGIVDDQVDFSEAKDPTAYRFLASYGIELALALSVYYVVFGTLLFSGILGCGRVPILGGRPYEVMCEEKELLQDVEMGTESIRKARSSRRSSGTNPV